MEFPPTLCGATLQDYKCGVPAYTLQGYRLLNYNKCGVPAYTLQGYRLLNYKYKKPMKFPPTLCGATLQLNTKRLRDSCLHCTGLLLTKIPDK